MSSTIAFLTINSIAALFLLERAFTLFQQNGYELKKFFSLPKGKGFENIILYIHIILSGSVVCLLEHMLPDKYEITFIISFLLLALEVFDIMAMHRFKVRIRYTKRMKRLFFSATLAVISTELICAHFSNDLGNGLMFIDKALTPIYAFLAAAILTPFENRNNKRYIKKAQIAFSDFSGLKIGVTGSYAKTSVKMILSKILESKYETLYSEKSYNTPLGLSLTAGLINDKTEVIVAELGARKIGDIKELMEIFKPDIGVLTGITTQHLETFKTVENIYKEKTQILKSKDFTIYNAEDKELAKRLSDNGNAYGASITDKSYPFFADEINLSAEGASFTMRLDKEKVKAKTKLLGKNNVINILIASAVAYRMGISAENIKERVSALDFIPHRLELITSANGVKILDDSYNSNPLGAKYALETLKLFQSNRVVMTCGLVELGEIEKSENKVLGVRMADVCDIAILIGSRGQEIEKGLKEANFSEDDIYKFQTLKEAEAYLPAILRAGDTLLILNDLPDKY